MIDEREQFRREIALQCLLVFLDNGGDREQKVSAAVEYADLLTEALDQKEVRR